MKLRILSLLGIALMLAIASCSEFEQYNANPNEPTEVSPDVLLTSSIRQSVTTMVDASFLLGNNAAQLTAKTLRTEVDAYNWNAFPTVWEGMYESLTDIHAVEEQARTQGNAALEGVAIVWKSWVYSVLTSTYGDIPYSEAMQGATGNFTPVYDAQADIYADLLAELDRADDLLAGGGTITGDILLGNDAAKWRKFGNSLRLRLLMRASDQLADAGTQFAAIVSEGNLMASNADNAALTYLTAFPNQFPLIPIKTGDFDAVGLSQTSLAVMSAHNDPRLMRYARPDNDDFTAAAQFTGADNGSASATCSKSASRLGVQYYNYPNLATYTSLGLPMAEGIVMQYAEVAFLLAEAAAKGWINDAIEPHYRNGVEASMEYYLVDYAPFGWNDFNDYYTNSGVAYSAVTDIWEQKWLALFFTGLEPYFEVRRWYVASGNDWSGIPFMDAPCDNLNNDALPMRFLYPGEEQSLNAVNYQAAVAQMGGNDQNTRMWLVQ